MRSQSNIKNDDVTVASYRTPPVDEKPFGGFSYSLGTQNLLVMESREDEHQILSTKNTLGFAIFYYVVRGLAMGKQGG